ncbi:MAG: hypothetical protein ACRELF_21990, partial [Gemmataceae bacterium]
LSKNGLSDYGRLRTVSLCDYASLMGLQKLKSYDLAELELDFDIAIVDGPIAGQFGAATRAVPLDWCVTRLKSDSVIYLDDAARPGEMEVISRIKLAHEKVEAKFFRTEKGLCRFAAIS